MPSRCCEFVDSRLRRSPPDRASAVPMDKPGKTQCVSPTLPTGRRLPHKLHSTPQQHGMILISGNGEITSRLYAFSLFFPGSCPNNRDRRNQTVIDTSAKVAFAKLYDRKTPITAAEILNDRVVPFYDEHGIRLSRMLTDRGTEFCGTQSHEYELYLAVEDIDHSRTKTKSPQTNGICERF